MAIQTLFGSVAQEPTLLDRLKAGVEKTRAGLVIGVEDVLTGRKEIDADLLDELEYTLITRRHRRAHHGRNSGPHPRARGPQNGRRRRRAEGPDSRASAGNPAGAASGRMPHVAEPPAVVLVVGVNGAGKTTTIGKLASRFKSEGRSVLLCAADTFRAAAIEQLEVWGERTDTDVIRQKPGARPERRAVRRAAGGQRAQGRLRHRGHRRPAADQREPDGGAGEDEPHREEA